ncbi:MAG: NTP transferase domain-containing protein [Acidimicrobiales bacterium]
MQSSSRPAGSRFAGDTHKLLADFRGKPVISWVFDAVVEAGFDTVYVTTGAVDLTSVIPAGVKEVAVPDWADGQARSLHAAIAQADADGHGAL